MAAALAVAESLPAEKRVSATRLPPRALSPGHGPRLPRACAIVMSFKDKIRENGAASMQYLYDAP